MILVAFAGFRFDVDFADLLYFGAGIGIWVGIRQTSAGIWHSGVISLSRVVFRILMNFGALVMLQVRWAEFWGFGCGLGFSICVLCWVEVFRLGCEFGTGIRQSSTEFWHFG